MKFMVIVKATSQSEAGIVPDQSVFEAMAKFNEEMINAGIMVAGEGLRESRMGARLRYSKGRHTVIDGPFAETKELVAGFWIIDVKDMDEAIAWMRKCPLDEGEELEIRKVWEASDWEQAGVPPEVIAEDERLRAKEEQIRARADR
jgi:hypothetical protein